MKLTKSPRSISAGIRMCFTAKSLVKTAWEAVMVLCRYAKQSMSALRRHNRKLDADLFGSVRMPMPCGKLLTAMFPKGLVSDLHSWVHSVTVPSGKTPPAGSACQASAEGAALLYLLSVWYQQAALLHVSVMRRSLAHLLHPLCYQNGIRSELKTPPSVLVDILCTLTVKGFMELRCSHCNCWKVAMHFRSPKRMVTSQRWEGRGRFECGTA